MCGRIIQASEPERLALGIVRAVVEPMSPRFKARYNGAPGQPLWVLREHPQTGECRLGLLRWGLIPSWSQGQTGGRRPINAKAETVHSLASFRQAFAHRRCLVPVDGFFEWQALSGARARQPYVIAMRHAAPFALAGIWENWRHPTHGWVRTFCILTTQANACLKAIHDRMPVIIGPDGYDRWLSPQEADPRDMLRPYPAGDMTLWPVSRRVNTPANDDAALIQAIEMPEQVENVQAENVQVANEPAEPDLFSPLASPAF
ncbi:SOS response-associated peptidase [Chelatococcus asaccharovorans]|uniref:SOS response-associated peptidase n=1 Tax=Chelatococcus asaccharovorans TaxID=28210 RepID=UPI00224C6371|nr:SOS response-associated peptidase [Chelatococcus asaccharovorans]CAH1671475.1 Abasic site processing protein [Chelatococcus asaccharovorans]CAH1677103.1 Abasic site processing protein [Chelatococcus asaccharovorans]